MRPLSETNWSELREELKHDPEEHIESDGVNLPASETNSMYDLTQSVKEKGVVLDAGREVRVKLYMGQVRDHSSFIIDILKNILQIFMCWLWFIPTFHMPQPSSPSDAPKAKFLLTRKELDFPLGVGSSIVDVEISLEWLRATDPEAVQPPARQLSGESMGEPAGIAATVEAIAAGNVGDVVEAKQAAED